MTTKPEVPTTPKRGRDVTSTQRKAAQRERASAEGGKQVAFALSADDVRHLETLLAAGYAPTQNDVFRMALREAAARQVRKKST